MMTTREANSELLASRAMALAGEVCILLLSLYFGVIPCIGLC
jgi:hypothetical protein